MITLNFRKSTEERPPIGKDILVISNENPMYGESYDALEVWKIEGFNGESGETYSHGIPLEKLPQKDLMVALNAACDTSMNNFSKLKFLWILKKEYDAVEKFF